MIYSRGLSHHRIFPVLLEILGECATDSSSFVARSTHRWGYGLKLTKIAHVQNILSAHKFPGIHTLEAMKKRFPKARIFSGSGMSTSSNQSHLTQRGSAKVEAAAVDFPSSKDFNQRTICISHAQDGTFFLNIFCKVLNNFIFSSLCLLDLPDLYNSSAS